MKLDQITQSRLGKLLGEFRKEFLWVGLFSLVANVLMLTPTLYMLQVYDRVLLSRNEITLLVLTILMISLFVFMAFAEWLRSRLLVRIGVRLDEALNSLVFHASFRAFMKQAFHDTNRTFQDLTNIRQFLTGTGVIAFFDMPWTPVYICVMFLLHPFIGMLGVLFALIQAGAAWMGHIRTTDAVEKAADTSVSANSFVQTKMRNIETVQAMGMTQPLRERWLEHHQTAIEKASEMHDRQRQQQSTAKFIRLTMQSLTLGAGALLVLNGEVSVGAMIAGNVLMSRALAPLDMMVTTWKQFVQAKSGFFRLNNLLTGYSEHIAHERSDIILRGEISVENLSAAAGEGRVPILHGLTTAFRPGELVAMIGPSGSGKSTFARCVLGIWPETKGTVRIDCISIDEWDRSVLGHHIGYLPQDVELFEGTFAENIARFNEVDPDKVVQAAKSTGIHEMILRFPKGYDTEIGRGGQILSGGQRQRVALARALYADPSILVLDEPNSSLDDAGEKALNKALRERADAGKTVVLITHRSSVLAMADRVIVMHEGHFTHDGPRQEVLRSMVKRKTTEAVSKV